LLLFIILFSKKKDIFNWTECCLCVFYLLCVSITSPHSLLFCGMCVLDRVCFDVDTIEFIFFILWYLKHSNKLIINKKKIKTKMIINFLEKFWVKWKYIFNGCRHHSIEYREWSTKGWIMIQLTNWCMIMRSCYSWSLKSIRMIVKVSIVFLLIFIGISSKVLFLLIWRFQIFVFHSVQWW
jgi:hypothetical protein